MDFGGSHSNFVPRLPPSYSSSPSPMSPLKDQQIKCAGEVIVDPGKENVGAAPPNKSILKNATTLSLKKQQKKLLKNAAGTSVDSAKKPFDSQTLRKETLKSVAFGRTTRLENAVLANQSKIPTSSTANRTNRTVIFSQEAQLLHKLVMAQQAEIAELRAKVDDLIAAADDQRRSREEIKESDAEQQQQTGKADKQQQKQNPEMLDKAVQAIPERIIFASPSFTSIRTQLPASPILRTAKKEQHTPSAVMFPLRDRPLDKQPHQKQNPETVDKADSMADEAIPERAIFASPPFISLRAQLPASPILRTAKKEQQTPSASLFPLRDASNQEKKLCFD
uniref:Uncharacterized protein n=1 Tax=Globodera rostochiensis TaxID=31243 RepID=A0A914HHA4_GLORO